MITMGKEGIRYEEEGQELSKEEGHKRLMKYRHKPPDISEWQYAEFLERMGGHIHERRVVEEPCE